MINLKSALTQTELDEGLDGLNDVSQAQVRTQAVRPSSPLLSTQLV